ncbi:putative ribonuclease P protein component [Necator americanus]|uniref:Putative ribonuclease P protein component n=1 Tax=Necator americanus TaxID=51031 RepID=W2TYY8_NECAM|nr:putative ribonuclease P protein component [Necator americanus]ETN86879.1 putative ribonuclease P protein component [Necator americanus]
MSMNHSGHPQDINHFYNNVDVDANQAGRIGPMQHPVAYQPSNGPKVMTSVQESQRMVVDQHQLSTVPKIMFPRQQFQPYIHPGQIQMQGSTQMPIQYPYCPVTYIPASPGQISCNYSAIANGNRMYSRGYIAHSKSGTRVTTEEKPPPLAYSPNPQRTNLPATFTLPSKAVDDVGSVYQYGIDDCDWLCVRTVAILIGESGFKPLSDLQISKGCVVFIVVLQDRNKNTTRASVYIVDTHIKHVMLGKCSSSMYVLAVSLNELGREALHPGLQWVERIKSYDLVFSINLLGHDEVFKSKLTNFFGSKLKYYAFANLRQNGRLVQSAVLVARYARFLEKVEGRKKNYERLHDRIAPESAGDNIEQNDLSIEAGDNYFCSITGRTGSTADSCSDANVLPQNPFPTVIVQENMNIAYPDEDLISVQCGEEAVTTVSNQEVVDGTSSLVCEQANKEGWSNSAESYNGDCYEVHRELTSLLSDAGDDLTKDIIESPSNIGHYISSDSRLSAAEYLRTFTCSDSQVIDFPEDFLALDDSSEVQTDGQKPLLPKSFENAQEALTLEDDDFEKAELSSLKFDGDITVDVGAVRQCMQKGAFMTGSLATFYFQHYIPYVILNNEFRKDKICFLDSENYGFIRRKCESQFHRYFDNEITREEAINAFGSRRKKKQLHPFVMSLIQFELVVIPLFWDNHWMLGLLQIFPGGVSGRLVLVDSKFNDPINKDVLTRISHNIYRHIATAIRAALVTLAKPRRLKDFTLVFLLWTFFKNNFYSFVDQLVQSYTL